MFRYTTLDSVGETKQELSQHDIKAFNNTNVNKQLTFIKGDDQELYRCSFWVKGQGDTIQSQNFREQIAMKVSNLSTVNFIKIK